jgi:hypothetical protein
MNFSNADFDSFMLKQSQKLVNNFKTAKTQGKIRLKTTPKLYSMEGKYKILLEK